MQGIHRAERAKAPRWGTDPPIDSGRRLRETPGLAAPCPDRRPVTVRSTAVPRQNLWTAKMMTQTELTLALHEKVLVEFDLDGRVVGLRAVVVNVLPSALWLGLSRPDSLLEQLVPDQPISLTFKRNGAALVASSRFASHLGSSRSRLFSVRWPDELQTVQRRAHVRMDTDCQLQYKITEGCDGEAKEGTGAGNTRDLSAGGLRFATRFTEDVEVAVGDELEIRIALGWDAVLAEAQVVRVEQERLPAGVRPRPGPPTMIVAARFISISDVAQDRIVRHLFSTQRQRRNGPRAQGRPEAPPARRRPRRRYSSEALW